jgi:hypothetical protein
MQSKLNDPFTSGEALSNTDRAILDVFTSLMRVEGMSPALAAAPASAIARPAQLHPTFPASPKQWGRLTPDNWNSHEACRKGNVRSLFDFSPSASPLPEFAGKTPAIHKIFGYPCARILSVNECWKHYGYDPSSSQVCSREVQILRMKRCVDLRLRYPDDLSAIDTHELHALRSDNSLHLRFVREFPAESREMTIKLLCHESKWTREQACKHPLKNVEI